MVGDLRDLPALPVVPAGDFRGRVRVHENIDGVPERGAQRLEARRTRE
jgi:hypothetical protein